MYNTTKMIIQTTMHRHPSDTKSCISKYTQVHTHKNQTLVARLTLLYSIKYLLREVLVFQFVIHFTPSWQIT